MLHYKYEMSEYIISRSLSFSHLDSPSSSRNDSTVLILGAHRTTSWLTVLQIQCLTQNLGSLSGKVSPAYGRTSQAHYNHYCPSGGGVGGLTLAVALSRYQDIAIDVYEAAQSFCEIGAGVGVWPRAFRVWISEHQTWSHASPRQLLPRFYENLDPTSNSNCFNAVVTNTRRNMVSGDRIQSYMSKLIERNVVPAVRSRKSDQAVGIELFDLMTKGRISSALKCILS